MYIDSTSRGYHVYKSVRTPVISEQLITQENGNAADLYAVAACKEDTTSSSALTIVGHVPEKSPGHAGISFNIMEKICARWLETKEDHLWRRVG